MKLEDKHKRFIVAALACYDTPSQVAESFKEEFGHVITRMQVGEYNPTIGSGRKLGKEWRDLFHATRKAFLEDVSTIPIANQATRLRVLQRRLERAEKANNPMLVLQILEQAAKEIGGAYGDRRRVEVSGPGGGPIKSENLHSVSDEELERIIAAART